MLWTDEMLIPKGAQNKAAAEAMMNYVYEPSIAAQLAAYIYYISPVEGVREEIAELDEEAPENPLLFPPEDVVARLHVFKPLNDEEDRQLNDLFAELSGV